MSEVKKENKSMSKTVDQKQTKSQSLSPKTAATTQAPESISTSLQPEVFDSYRYNAISEMKEAANMEETDVTKILSTVEEKQQLGPVTIDINSKDKTDLEIVPKLFSNVETKIYESDSNFFIPVIKLWQTYASWIGTYNEIGKAWMNMIISWTQMSYKKFNSM